MKAFTDRRRAAWLVGLAVLIFGFVLAALLLPSLHDPMREAGPSVHVPRMQNVPPDGERVKLETGDRSKQP